MGNPKLYGNPRHRGGSDLGHYEVWVVEARSGGGSGG